MRIRRKYLFYVLAFTSAGIAAGVSALDSAVTALYIPNPWVLGYACFLVGVLVSLALLLFL